MAGIEIRGIEELKAKFAMISKTMAGEAMEEAHARAAKIFSQAAKNAAPVGKDPKNKPKGKKGHGRLKASVKTYKANYPYVAKYHGRLSRTMVGPSKDNGYYGFFLSEGWKMPLLTTYHWTRAGRWRPEAWLVKSKRRLRSEATPTTHSQIGTTVWKQIEAPYPKWFENAIDGVMPEATRAMMTALDYYLKK